MTASGSDRSDKGHSTNPSPEIAPGLADRLVQASPFAMFVVDEAGVVTWANEAAGQLVGLPVEECIGRNTTDFVHPADIDLVAQSLAFATSYRDLMGPVDIRYIGADGGVHYSRFWSRNLIDDPLVGGLLVVMAKEAALDVLGAAVVSVATDEPLATTLEFVVRSVLREPFGAEAAIVRFGDREHASGAATTGAPLIATASDLNLPWVVAALEDREVIVDDIDGHEALAGLGTDFKSLWCRPIPVDGQDRAAMSIWTHQEFSVTANQSLQFTQAVRTAQLAFRQADARGELRHAASHDPLTGLQNRELFKTLGAELDSAAVLFIDLDKFKTVNDTLGHPAGDRVLRTIAKRIRAAVRSTDHVVRIGGDEFVVLTTPAPSTDLVTEMAQRIIGVVKTPVHLREVTLEVGATIGVAVSTGPCVLDDLIASADKVMLDVKANEPGTWRVAD